MSAAGFYLFGGAMNIQIMIGGIRFRLDSDFEIMVEESLTPFLCTSESDCDVSVKMISNDKKAGKPQIPMRGEDILLEYYYQNDQMTCLAKGGVGGYLSTTVYDESFASLECRLHFRANESMKTLGNLLRLLPMCGILQQKDVLFFHASQIEENGKGILFTAPSGTGKTTQAKLWRDFRGAKIVCNDRTLVRDGKTYGYPVDGSEPVISGEILTLGAIVLLEQKPENRVRRLTPKEALLKLLPQLIIDAWNPQARVLAIEQMITCVSQYPVYLLECTPDEAAVLCLEQQLKMDGVM